MVKIKSWRLDLSVYMVIFVIIEFNKKGTKSKMWQLGAKIVKFLTWGTISYIFYKHFSRN